MVVAFCPVAEEQTLVQNEHYLKFEGWPVSLTSVGTLDDPIRSYTNRQRYKNDQNSVPLSYFSYVEK